MRPCQWKRDKKNSKRCTSLHVIVRNARRGHEECEQVFWLGSFIFTITTTTSLSDCVDHIDSHSSYYWFPFLDFVTRKRCTRLACFQRRAWSCTASRCLASESVQDVLLRRCSVDCSPHHGKSYVAIQTPLQVHHCRRHWYSRYIHIEIFFVCCFWTLNWTD